MFKYENLDGEHKLIIDENSHLDTLYDNLTRNFLRWGVSLLQVFYKIGTFYKR